MWWRRTRGEAAAKVLKRLRENGEVGADVVAAVEVVAKYAPMRMITAVLADETGQAWTLALYHVAQMDRQGMSTAESAALEAMI